MTNQKFHYREKSLNLIIIFTALPSGCRYFTAHGEKLHSPFFHVPIQIVNLERWMCINSFEPLPAYQKK